MQRHFATTFEEWRGLARSLVLAGVRPDDVQWSSEPRQRGLFDADTPRPTGNLRLPRVFVDTARRAAHHRGDERWAVAYRVLWRLVHGSPRLFDDPADPDVHRLRRLASAVDRDVHAMEAFVRFRRVVDAEGERFVAWYRPEHLVLPLVGPFFADRFRNMRWAILTPDGSLGWDGQRLELGPGLPRSAAPTEDELEALWKTYYEAVFNPARVNPNAMRQHMPRRHWDTMPETARIGELVREAATRVGRLDDDGAALGERLRDAPLPTVRALALECTRCPLWTRATQTVFGEGPTDADIVLVGEQPGDQEDRTGRPFVGPAGEVLDRALLEAGLQRDRLYVTNAVKHFKWRPVGKKGRLHQRPDGGEIELCKPWLDAELAALAPRLIVGLGATAGQSLLGRRPKIAAARGTPHRGPGGAVVLVTYHPSAVLRSGDGGFDEAIFAALRDDLGWAKALLERGTAGG